MKINMDVSGGDGYKRFVEYSYLMAVVKVIELVGVSDKGWDEAVREALREAAKTVRNIRKVEVVGFSGEVEGGVIKEYYARVRLYFEVERP